MIQISSQVQTQTGNVWENVSRDFREQAGNLHAPSTFEHWGAGAIMLMKPMGTASLQGDVSNGSTFQAEAFKSDLLATQPSPNPQGVSPPQCSGSADWPPD